MVGVFKDFGMLQTWKGMDKLLLKFMREAGVESLEINRFAFFEFWFKEKLVAFLVGKRTTLDSIDGQYLGPTPLMTPLKTADSERCS